MRSPAVNLAPAPFAEFPTELIGNGTLMLQKAGSANEAAINRLVDDDVEFLKHGLGTPDPHFYAFTASRYSEQELSYALVDGGEVQGLVGLHSRRTPEQASMYYWLARKAQGKGLMASGAAILCDEAFSQGLKVIEFRIATWNRRSRALGHRLGAKAIGGYEGYDILRLERSTYA